MRRAARVAILAAIVLVVAVDLRVYAPKALLIPGSQCSWSDSWDVLLHSAPVKRVKDQIEPHVRFVRTEAGLDLWNSPQGNFWMVHGDTILPLLLAEQQVDIYEPPGHQVHAGDVVLDCGANVGMFSRTALSRGAELVIAIEPSPRTLEALRRNLAPEIQSGRVIVVPKGVWDHDDQLDLTLDEANEGANSLVLPMNGRKVRVPLTTVDEIVAELKLPRVDFIKMDIEGAEKQALEGARSTIQRFRPRMSLSSEHLPDDYQMIPAKVKSLEPHYRYNPCDCEENSGLKALVLAFDPVLDH